LGLVSEFYLLYELYHGVKKFDFYFTIWRDVEKTKQAKPYHESTMKTATSG